MNHDIIKDIETIITAMRNISYTCEKSINLCDAISAGYPMHKSLDEMIFDFITWKETLEDMEEINY